MPDYSLPEELSDLFVSEHEVEPMSAEVIYYLKANPMIAVMLTSDNRWDLSVELRTAPDARSDEFDSVTTLDSLDQAARAAVGLNSEFATRYPQAPIAAEVAAAFFDTKSANTPRL